MKKLHIFKWIYILLFTRVTCLKFLQLNDVSGNKLINIIRLIKDNLSPKTSYWKISDASTDRQSFNNIKVFNNKILIKRAVPHGYKGEYEHDEKFNTLYKPLVRIHKISPNFNTNNGEIEPEGQHNAVIILDEDDLTNKRFLDMLNDVDTNSGDLDYDSNVPRVFRGAGVENVVLDFMKDKNQVIHDDKDRDSDSDYPEFQLKAFAPMVMTEKQSKKAAKVMKLFLRKVRSLLRNKEDTSPNSKWSPSKKFNLNDSELEFIDKILGLMTHKQKRTTENDIAKRDLSRIFKSFKNQMSNHRYHVGSDHERKNRHGVKNSTHLSRWFGPVGQISGKQTKRQKPHGPTIGRDLQSVFSSLKNLPSKRRDKQIFSQKKIILKSRSAEEYDPLFPVDPYLVHDEEDEVTEKPMRLPKYPFHNFWTYQKTIYQDECRGNTIKLGNMCVAIPESI